MTQMVDICIPVYNAETTIERTLKSLLDQTHYDINIHIVDNVSTDNTLDITRGFSDERIIIHENKIYTRDGESNWNRCFQYMDSEYASIFHADDIYTKRMIENQVDILDNHIDVGAVFTGSKLIDQNDNTVCVHTMPERYTHNKELNIKDIMDTTLRYGNQLMTPSPLYRSKIYKFMSPFRHESFGYSSDLDMWLRTANKWNLFVINEPLMHHRLGSPHTQLLIHALRTSEEMFFRTVDYHLSKLPPQSQDALDMYEMRRVEDKIHCLKNTIKKMGVRFPKMLLWGISKKMRQT
jgi:glycosyltransferase involved in cell wall biosynthesis